MTIKNIKVKDVDVVEELKFKEDYSAFGMSFDDPFAGHCIDEESTMVIFKKCFGKLDEDGDVEEEMLEEMFEALVEEFHSSGIKDVKNERVYIDNRGNQLTGKITWYTYAADVEVEFELFGIKWVGSYSVENRELRRNTVEEFIRINGLSEYH